MTTLLPPRPNNSLVGARTHVSIAIDESSSMGKIASTVTASFNDYLEVLREQPAEVRATVWKFATEVESIIVGRALMQVPPLTDENYSPNGNTALYDALGMAMRTLDSQMGGADRAIVVVVTDGRDNVSTAFDATEIAAMIELRANTGRWTFVYIGPSNGSAETLGIEHALQLGAGAAGFRAAMAQLAEATAQFLLTDGSKPFHF